VTEPAENVGLDGDLEHPFLTPEEPAYFQHHFEVMECATPRGTPKAMVTFSRGCPMDAIVSDALEALNEFLNHSGAHPGMSLSTRPQDWSLEFMGAAQPLVLLPDLGDLEPKLMLRWNLGVRDNSITMAVPAGAHADD